MIDLQKCFLPIERAFRMFSEGRVNQPPVGYITFPEQDGDCHIKYGHIEGDSFFVVKLATGFPLNSQKNVPNGNGLLLVLSAETGEVQALLHDEMYLTDVRTGIAGAIASHLLARSDARNLLVIGTGIQAKIQIEAHAAKFEELPSFAIWGRDREKALTLAEELSKEHQIKSVDDLEEACRHADIIVTTTASRAPLIEADWIHPGTHISAVGADAAGKRELQIELIEKADLVVADSIAQCVDHGEIQGAAQQGVIDNHSIVELGTILEGSANGRRSDEAITIADLTGIAAQDIAMAGLVLKSQLQ